MSYFIKFTGNRDQIKISSGAYPNPLCKYKQIFSAGYTIDKNGVKEKIKFY